MGRRSFRNGTGSRSPTPRKRRPPIPPAWPSPTTRHPDSSGSGPDNRHASAKYQAEFYKPGESKPFETLTGDQSFYVGDEPLASHTPDARLEISFGHSTTSPQAEIEQLSKTLGDPKSTDAQRGAAMTRIGELQRKMLEGVTKALQTDPASLNKAQDDFGCGLLQVYPSKGGVVEGMISCGKNFNDGVLKVTGTMTRVR